MKKTISLMLVFLMLVSCISISAFAQESAIVYVSVADKGKLVAAQEKVSVTDIDSDGVLTVNDALYAVHKSVYPGGASAGYSYYVHKDYGLSLGKLWGDSSGNFGYYLNNKSCWGLADKISSGDYLNAFIYSDGKFYSDKYCFFETRTVSANANSGIELTLSGVGYDANWNPVTLPVAGAEITVDGAATGVKTDSNGKATIQISSAGTHIISAVSSTETLVPPVCEAEVSGGIFASILSAITSFFNAVLNFIRSLIK